MKFRTSGYWCIFWYSK